MYVPLRRREAREAKLSSGEEAASRTDPAGGSGGGAAGLALSQPLWAYALLALLDVEANALLVAAYRYTSLTSVTLLDCFTIPCALALSALVLRARYRPGHYAGGRSLRPGRAAGPVRGSRAAAVLSD